MRTTEPMRTTGALGRHVHAAAVVLASPPLRRCQLGLAAARCVDLAQLVIVSAHLYGDGGAAAVALYGVVRAVAPAVGVPAVVTATDRLGHGRLLALLAACAAAATAGMAAVIVTGGPVPALLVLAAGVHVAVGAFRPVTAALMPALVRTPEELMTCTATAGFLDAATTFAGPLLAAALLVLTDPARALPASAVLLGVAALLAARLPRAPTMPPMAAGGTAKGGVRAFLTTPEIAVLGALGLCQTLVRGALYVLVVVFTVQVMGHGEGVVGLLLGAIGVGGMVGLPLAMALVGRHRLYRSYGWGLVLWGAPIALAAGVPELAVVLLLFAVVGVGNDVVDISLFTAFPRAVPDRVLPTMLGMLESAFQIGMAAGAAIGGALLLVLDPRTALLVVGLLLPLVSLLAAPWLRQFDRRLETRDAEVELLRRQPPFTDLPVPVLDTVAARLQTAAFAPGEVIMRHGELGDRYVVLLDGVVRVHRDGAVVAELGAGDAFGEIAVVRDGPRTATVVAVAGVVARTLDGATLRAAMECDPRARAAAESVARAPSGGARPGVPR